jgi:drug/metabolite transporter (DMT)-like permease
LTAQAASRRASIDGFAAAMMIGLTFLWGLNQVAIKVTNEGYNPVLSVVVRSAVGMVLVWLWCRYRRIPLFERDGTLLAGLIAGALFGIEFVLIFIGLDFTTAARSVLMVNAMPFWVLIGAHLFLGERMNGIKVAGLLLAFAGVALVFMDDLSTPGPYAIWGDLMCLIAGLLWGATTIVIRKSRLSEVSGEKTLMYQLAVSALIAMPLIPLAGPLLREPGLLSTASLAYQAVVVVTFTYVLWFSMIRIYPASGLSSFAFLSPVFGVLCGGLLLGEPLTASIFAALALIAAGLLLVNRPARPSPPA